MDSAPPRVDVFGVAVSLCSVEDVAGLVLSPPHTGRVVAIGNVHSVMTARQDSSVAEALAAADIVTPDGMPLVWALKVNGHSEAVRVTGIDVMSRSLAMGLDSGARHFFYGSSPEVLESLIARVRDNFPGTHVAGSISPPFRELTAEETSSYLEEIRVSSADVVWVGLGMPKQELWMHDATENLPGVTLVGVGAAFDWYAGNVRRAPEWMQKAGLEWLYRLLGDPRRLWRRYVFNNPHFLLLLAARWIKNRVGGRARRGAG